MRMVINSPAEGSKAIVKFVEEGGLCINAEQDHDDNVGCRPMDWFPVKINGAERPGISFYPQKKKRLAHFSPHRTK